MFEDKEKWLKIVKDNFDTRAEELGLKGSYTLTHDYTVNQVSMTTVSLEYTYKTFIAEGFDDFPFLNAEGSAMLGMTLNADNTVLISFNGVPMTLSLAMPHEFIFDVIAKWLYGVYSDKTCRYLLKVREQKYFYTLYLDLLVQEEHPLALHLNIAMTGQSTSETDVTKLVFYTYDLPDDHPMKPILGNQGSIHLEELKALLIPA